MSAQEAEAGIKHSQFEACFRPIGHTAFVYRMVRNLGEMLDLQIHSYGAVARSRHHPTPIGSTLNAVARWRCR